VPFAYTERINVEEMRMTVGELCNREVIVTTPDTTVAEAARLMRRFHVGSLVIIDETESGRFPVGLVTDRDIVVEVIAAAIDPEAVTVVDIMTRALETLPEKTDFWDALTTMRASGIRRMPVVDGSSRLVGILTLDDSLEVLGNGILDLARLVQREIRHEAATRSSSGEPGA
jgi:CBS domain-containing protein